MAGRKIAAGHFALMTGFFMCRGPGAGIWRFRSAANGMKYDVNLVPKFLRINNYERCLKAE